MSNPYNMSNPNRHPVEVLIGETLAKKRLEHTRRETLSDIKKMPPKWHTPSNKM